MRCVVLLQLAAAVFLLLLGQSEAAAGGKGRRVVRYRCQYLRTHNRTKIVCSPVEVYNQPTPGASLTSVSMQPEAFNGQGAQKGRVCHKLRELAERLASFEEGAWKYCDPSSCLRESPHCTNSVLSTECSQCLGRCWIMYAFPAARADSKAKDFPCDPLECGGAHIFCGGYKFKDD